MGHISGASRCVPCVLQEEFEKENHVESVLAELPEDATEEDRQLVRMRTKMRMLGNIRFIGELYKQKMLTEKIMHECLIKLLGEVENPDEDEIECLCKLLTTIGKMIDHAKAKPHMDQYFTRMSEMSQNASLANRMRFMLQEVIDLRRGNWVTRKADPNAKSQSELERQAGKGSGRGSGDMRNAPRGGAGKGAPAGKGGGGGKGDEWSVAGKPSEGGKGDGPAKSESGPSAAAPPPQPKLTADQLTDKIEQNLEEYFSGAGLAELVQCTRDLQPRVEVADDLGKQLIQTAMMKGFDARTDEQREKVPPPARHPCRCARRPCTSPFVWWCDCRGAALHSLSSEPFPFGRRWLASSAACTKRACSNRPC
jgi:hypothetical protein